MVFREVTDEWSPCRPAVAVYRGATGAWPQFALAREGFKAVTEGWWKFPAALAESKGLMGEWWQFGPGPAPFKAPTEEWSEFHQERVLCKTREVG